MNFLWGNHEVASSCLPCHFKLPIDCPCNMRAAGNEKCWKYEFYVRVAIRIISCLLIREICCWQLVFKQETISSRNCVISTFVSQLVYSTLWTVFTTVLLNLVQPSSWSPFFFKSLSEDFIASFWVPSSWEERFLIIVSKVIN